MAKAADLGALLAKLPTAGKDKAGSFFGAKLEEGKAKLERKTARAKGLAAKGVLAHYLASGLGVGSVLLVLHGAWSLLSRALDPGYAALGLGAGLIAVLVGGVVLATREKKPEAEG